MTTIFIQRLDDILKVDWIFKHAGTLKNKDGDSFITDIYPRYEYEPPLNEPLYISETLIKRIHFNKVSPRTKLHKNLIGKILIKCHTEDYKLSKIDFYCEEYEIKTWLKDFLGYEAKLENSTSPIMPKDRQDIQKANEQKIDRMNHLYPYRNNETSFDSVINDAFEGDESNYWNID